MKKILIILIVIFSICAAAYFLLPDIFYEEIEKDSGASRDAVEEISLYQYSESYSDTALGFSFKYPADFTVTPVYGEDSTTILIQNLSKKIGLQIIISPIAGEDIDLTADIVRESLPDTEVTEPMEIMIRGAGVRKGIVFVSDNEEFGGKSSELWFIHRNNLYQLSTYGELKKFLTGLFETWQFKSQS